MSDHLPDPESSGRWPLDDGHTEEYPTIAHALATPLDRPEWLAGDDAGDADEEWVSQTTHGIRLGMPVAALLAVVLVAAGFWGGAELQKNQGGTSSSLAGVAARFRSAAGAGATGATGSRSLRRPLRQHRRGDGDDLRRRRQHALRRRHLDRVGREGDAHQVDNRHAQRRRRGDRPASRRHGHRPRCDRERRGGHRDVGFRDRPRGQLRFRWLRQRRRRDQAPRGTGSTGSNTTTTPALFGGG